MKYSVTIKSNLTREDYSFNDPNADLTIEGNLTCLPYINLSSNGTTLNAKSVTTNGQLNSEKIRIIANSILVNNHIISQEELVIKSHDFLDLNAKIASINSQISLTAKRIILREDIHSRSFSGITADKMLLLGDIKSLRSVEFSIKDYIIKVGSLPLIGFGFEH